MIKKIQAYKWLKWTCQIYISIWLFSKIFTAMNLRTESNHDNWKKCYSWLKVKQLFSHYNKNLCGLKYILTTYLCPLSILANILFREWTQIMWTCPENIPSKRPANKKYLQKIFQNIDTNFNQFLRSSAW